MMLPSREIVSMLRESYPVGTRVVLLQMEDPYAPPVGTHGTVFGVDDTGSLLVNWDSGSSLSVLFGVDSVTKEVIE